MIFFVLFATYFFSAIVLPFPNWTSFRVVVIATLIAPDITIRQRTSMLLFLLKEVVLLPIWALFWVADELFFATYHDQKIREPIFIVSQPRSGTTFLLRTLSEDKDSFLSVKHLEWRYPYITFWLLVDRLGLRPWLENRSYWPNTELGNTCKKIHAHVLGNYEEFGIFLEERFFHHYFVFRRFPFKPVLDRISRFDGLADADKDNMISTFLRVIRKVYFYRGNDEIFLAKENESVEFCRAVIDKLPDARLLMICREPQPMLNSYLTMSVTCTQVKHGVDPTHRTGWNQMNTAFRRDQCRQFVDFWSEYRLRRKAILVSFRDFTTDVQRTTTRIYKQFNINLNEEFLKYLEQAQSKQDKRQSGYQNLTCSEEGFEFYSEFVRRATLSNSSLEAAQ